MNEQTQNGSHSTSKKLFLLLLLQILLILEFDVQFNKLSDTVEKLVEQSNRNANVAIREIVSDDEQIEELFKRYKNALKSGDFETIKPFLTENSQKKERDPEQLMNEYEDIKEKEFRVEVQDKKNALIVIKQEDQERKYMVKLVADEWRIEYE